MPDTSNPTLFLAIPGTQETRELDLESVRSAVARGEIPLDNWAWSAQRNAWLPLSELPEFAAAAVPAPVPVQPVRVAAKQPEPVKVAVPAQAVKVQPAQPRAKAGHAATHYSKPIEEHHEFPIIKIVCSVLGFVIVALVAINYFLVDQPFRAAMAKTPFARIQAHAHLGAFVQPNVLLIHILPSRDITSDDFADLLTALTRSAPHQVVAGYPFNAVSLTSGWVGQYVIPVEDWSGFADMGGYSEEEKKQYVISHLERIDGQPLLVPNRRETTTQRQARENEAWQELVAKFHSS